MKIAEGRRVRISIDGKVGTAKLYRDDNRYWRIKNCDKSLKVADGFWVEEPDGERYHTIDWIEPLSSTDIRDLYVGAKVKEKHGNLQEVLAMSGRGIGLSFTNNFNKFISWYTLEELIRLDYTLVPEEPEEKEEMITVTISKKTYDRLRDELK